VFPVQGNPNKEIEKMRKGMFVLIAAFLCALSVQAVGWDAEVRSVNEWDEDNEHVSGIQPQIRYKGDGWKAHVEYLIPVEPESEDGTIEQEVEIKVPAINGLAIKNEVYYSIEDDDLSAELTPKWYKKFWGIKAGFELEIDYLKADRFDIYEVEIEPTVKKCWEISEKSEFELEFELPVTRLYSKTKKDFEIEELAVLGIYDYVVSDAAAIEVRGELHYDVQDDEFEKVLEVALKYKF
jgi:hypothetical protein